MIGLLQAGRGHNTHSLAEECGVCRRTVFRDLDLLRLAGVPLTFDEDQQRYHVPGTFYLPPTDFTPEEALSLLVLCHELGDRDGLPFHAPARRAALKLESSLSPRLREYLREVSAAVRVRLPPTNRLAGHETTYQQLLDAMATRRCVRIHYDSLTEWRKIATKLSPYRLLFSRRSWYVIGRSSLHRATRTFNVGRILRLEPLDERYRVPRGFSIEQVLRNAWHLIPERGPDQRVVVRFEKMVAQNVAEVAWHKTQRLVWRRDGRLDFHVTVSGLNEISWWVLGYGDQAEVIRPTALRELIVRRCRRLLDRYGQPESSAAAQRAAAKRALGKRTTAAAHVANGRGARRDGPATNTRRRGRS
jgi:predicted DNA-binding transcriptional regulator YafY